jgi:hypothetical protein
MDTYKRVYEKYPDLAKSLIGQGKEGPKLLSLMTGDLSGQTPDTQVQKFFSDPNAKLPDGTKINAEPINPQEWDKEYNKNQAWNQYRTQKAQLLTYVKKIENNPLAKISDNPDAEAVWKKFLVDLGKVNKDWAIEYNQNATGDIAYTYAQGMKTITNNKKFMTANKDNQFFQQMKFFVDQRQKLSDYAQKMGKGYGQATQNAWANWLQGTTAGRWDPRMQQIIDRYFITDKLTGTN